VQSVYIVTYTLIFCYFDLWWLSVWWRVAVLLSQIADAVVQHSIIATDWTTLPYAAIFEANSFDLSRSCMEKREKEREREREREREIHACVCLVNACMNEFVFIDVHSPFSSMDSFVFITN